MYSTSPESMLYTVRVYSAHIVCMWYCMISNNWLSIFKLHPFHSIACRTIEKYAMNNNLISSNFESENGPLQTGDKSEKIGWGNCCKFSSTCNQKLIHWKCYKSVYNRCNRCAIEIHQKIPQLNRSLDEPTIADTIRFNGSFCIFFYCRI